MAPRGDAGIVPVFRPVYPHIAVRFDRHAAPASVLHRVSWSRTAELVQRDFVSGKGQLRPDAELVAVDHAFAFAVFFHFSFVYVVLPPDFSGGARADTPCRFFQGFPKSALIPALNICQYGPRLFQPFAPGYCDFSHCSTFYSSVSASRSASIPLSCPDSMT